MGLGALGGHPACPPSGLAVHKSTGSKEEARIEFHELTHTSAQVRIPFWFIHKNWMESKSYF